MPDIAKEKRRFRVYIDKRVTGAEVIEEDIEVLAGEDAEEVCNEWLQTLLSNSIDSGWYELKPKDPPAAAPKAKAKKK